MNMNGIWIVQRLNANWALQCPIDLFIYFSFFMQYLHHDDVVLVFKLEKCEVDTKYIF